MNSLKEKYTKEIIPELEKKHNYTTVMAVPKLEKIVVNMGVGDATTNSKLLDVAVSELEKITGQQPVITRAKKSLILIGDPKSFIKAVYNNGSKERRTLLKDLLINNIN